MKKDSKALTVRLSDQQLVLLARAGVQAMFDMVVDGQPNATVSIGYPVTLSPEDLPAIGAEWEGGIYAGLSIEDNKPVALVLLPGDEKLPWDAARAWATKQGGVLPSRFDQLVLFKNLKSQFKDKWYWSGEQCAPDPCYSWYQIFGDGGKDYTHKDETCRARAVRRVLIER